MTLSLDTAYRSFGGEVEASSTPTICRLPDSRRHQLWAIAHTRCLVTASTPEPEGGARCVSSARRDLYGGRLVTAVPTVTIAARTLAARHPSQMKLRHPRTDARSPSSQETGDRLGVGIERLGSDTPEFRFCLWIGTDRFHEGGQCNHLGRRRVLWSADRIPISDRVAWKRLCHRRDF